MPYTTYKVLHLLGLVCLFISLGAILFHSFNSSAKKFEHKKFLMIFHGVGLLFLLVGGFGMMALLGIHSFPSWIWGKLLVWLLLGVYPAVIFKNSSKAKLLWAGAILLAFKAFVLVIYKPGF